MIEEISKFLSSQNYQEIRLGCVKGNQQAENFWRKNHFEKTGFSYDTEDYTVEVLRRVCN